MKGPRSCQHQSVLLCDRCLADFKSRHALMRDCQRKGVRVQAALHHKLTLTEWLELNAIISRVLGTKPFAPQILIEGEFQPLTREELPTDV